jgi:hypothetical protein
MPRLVLTGKPSNRMIVLGTLVGIVLSVILMVDAIAALRRGEFIYRNYQNQPVVAGGVLLIVPPLLALLVYMAWKALRSRD